MGNIKDSRKIDCPYCGMYHFSQYWHNQHIKSWHKGEIKPPKPTAKHTVAVDELEKILLAVQSLNMQRAEAKAELGKLFMDMVGEDEPDGYDRLLGIVEDIEGKTFNLIELTSSEPESIRNQLRAKLRQRIKAIFGKVD